MSHPAGGAMSLVLHAHLPYVRHPEHPSFLEEDWLYEAITETYVPLLRMMDRLEADGVPWSMTMSMTPPLCEMLADGLLMDRYAARLEALIAIAEAEAERREGTAHQDGARFYVEELHAVRDVWNDRYDRQILRGFRRHQDRGALCIVTCGATHGYLPLMATDEARRAQILVAQHNYRKHFGRDPDGIWLPECAWAPGLDRWLEEAGIRFFFTETHGVGYANPRPRFGHLRPVLTERGVAVFGRDPECSKRVWSAEEGYPGDFNYREFYRDLGWDAPREQVASILEDGPRRGIGLKLHRVTGDVALNQKEAWVPAWAFERAALHGRDFFEHCRARASHLAQAMDVEPHLTAPFDAELFGHWWFEGPAFLESFFREAATRGPASGLRMTTPRQWLRDHSTLQVCEPAGSSWGDKGDYGVWLNGGNAWMYEHLHRAEERMVELATRFTTPTELERQALNHAARELVLAQASDWAFIVTMDTVVPYANKRTKDHLNHFNALYDELMQGRLREETLSSMEWSSPIFGEIHYGWWAPLALDGRPSGGAVSTVRS